jgi:hypothetical protein
LLRVVYRKRTPAFGPAFVRLRVAGDVPLGYPTDGFRLE